MSNVCVIVADMFYFKNNDLWPIIKILQRPSAYFSLSRIFKLDLHLQETPCSLVVYTCSCVRW